MNCMPPLIPFVELYTGLNKGHKAEYQTVYLYQTPVPIRLCL